MHHKVFLKLFLFSFLLFNNLRTSAQDSIPQSQPIDTTKIDTVVIRVKQYKVKNIRRGVNLTSPFISFKRTKPLTQSPKRFRVPSFWERINRISIGLSEVAFVNWNAGGDNAISALGTARFARNYKFRYVQWDNELEFTYGVNAQDGQKLRKTDDAIRLSSTFGYRKDTLSNWYYSAKANFNTQFTNGYKYPDRATPISRFMAPGYTFLGAGASYISKNQKFNLYLSPLTQRSTFVLDQVLADKGAFGVQKAVLDADGNIIQNGEKVFFGLGILITNNWETEVSKNVKMRHRLSLYTDYLADFGNIDVDWELNFNLKVNKYISASIGTHIIYDDDILFDEQKDENGVITNPGKPRIQLKQILGVGVAYDF